MHIQIRASQDQKAILLLKKINPEFKISWFINEVIDADVYVDVMCDNKNQAFSEVFTKPVIINSVISTCKLFSNNYCRINAWNGFLEKDKIEAATLNETLKTTFEKVLNGLGFEVIFVADIIGLVVPRTISMIINEAYFGLDDGISSKNDIDIAMKLGTNYPYGPFEWAEKIGLSRIKDLLFALEKTDPRYKPSNLLIKEAN